MATKNDITGDELISKMNSQAFRDNFDRIFGVKKKERYVPPPLPTTEEVKAEVKPTTLIYKPSDLKEAGITLEDLVKMVKK